MMTVSAGSLVTLRTSTAALLAGLQAERWSDVDCQLPSLLPDWTRGHVLSHLARNADGIARALAGSLRGEIVPRYPAGKAARDADIHAGATRPATELVADVQDSADRLDRVFGTVADADGWALPTEDRPAGDYVAARWREVEVHRVDLAGAYTAADWPATFVSHLLPDMTKQLGSRGPAMLVEITAPDSVTTDLPGRVWQVGAGEAATVRGPDWAVLAWLCGRPAASLGRLSCAPQLAPWL